MDTRAPGLLVDAIRWPSLQRDVTTRPKSLAATPPRHAGTGVAAASIVFNNGPEFLPPSDLPASWCGHRLAGGVRSPGYDGQLLPRVYSV